VSDDVTASVHYIGFFLTPAQVEAFASGPVDVAIDHPHYAQTVTFSDQTRDELLTDLR
jgi:ABC-type sugar transport system substrate-binding protein